LSSDNSADFHFIKIFFPNNKDATMHQLQKEQQRRNIKDTDPGQQLCPGRGKELPFF